MARVLGKVGREGLKRAEDEVDRSVRMATRAAPADERREALDALRGPCWRGACGDLGLLKLVGRVLSRGDPRALASEQQVREFFAPYGEWAGLAATHTTAL